MTTAKQRAEAAHLALIKSIREGSGRGLSLDLSSKTMGYAVWHHGLVAQRDTIDLVHNAPIEERLYRARASFCKLLECWTPALVVCEGPSLHSPALAIIAQAKVKAVCLLVAYEKGVPFPDVVDALAPMSVKLVFTGKGRWMTTNAKGKQEEDKAPVIHQAKTLLGLAQSELITAYEIYDEHAADAIAVGYAAGFSRIALDMLFQPTKPTKKAKR